MSSNRNRTVSNPYSACAFYGVDTSPRAKRAFFNSCMRWWKSCKLTPDKASLQGAPFSKRTTTFRHAEKAISEFGFAQLQAMSLAVLADNGTDVVRHAVSSAELNTKGAWSSFLVSAAVANIDQPSFLALATECVRVLHPGYGIAYRMPLEKGPVFYAVGIIYGMTPADGDDGDTDREEEEIARWGTIGMRRAVWNQGLVRDVYPWNFLTERHLERPIDGQPLRDWISADNDRGTLRDVAEHRMELWAVADENIETIRRSLWDAGMILGSD